MGKRRDNEASQKELEMAKRRRRVERYHARGLTQEEIAEIIGVDRSTISRDLKAVKEHWMDKAAEDHDEKVAEARAKVDAVLLEAWRQWVESQKREKQREKRQLVNGQWVAVEEIVESPQPVYKYLDIIGDCIDRIAKLDGLYKPFKVAPTNVEGTREYGGGLSDEQRIALLTQVLSGIEQRAAENGGEQDV